MNNLKFVVIDVETTGLTPSQNEIIEIGMVKIENGSMTDTFESFIKPKVKIPPIITKLTGIRDKDVTKAPIFIELIDKVLEFIGDSVLIGYNIGFDFAMLNSALMRENLPLLKNQTIDTLDLFSIVKPTYPSYKLEYIANNYLKKTDNFHRALNDASITAELFINSLKDIENNKELLELISFIFKDSDSILNEIFQNLESKQKIEKFKLLDILNVNNLENKADTLNSDITTKKLYAQYEIEPEKKIIKKINHFLNKDSKIVINTKDGDNNYLCCLIETAIWAKKNNQAVTISFDEYNQQIIKRIKQITQGIFNISTVEKPSNYACLYKINNLFKNIRKNRNTSKLPDFAALLHWLQITEEGKIEELHKRISSIFEKSISADAIYCKNKSCKFAGSCFINCSKQIAQNSHLVLVNHQSLLPFFSGKKEININKTIILDAHKLINFDRSSRVESVSTKSIHNLSNKLINRKKNIYQEISSKADNPEVTSLCEQIINHINSYNDNNEILLSVFEKAIASSTKVSRKQNISNINLVEILKSPHIERIKEYINQLNNHKNNIQNVNNRIIEIIKDINNNNKNKKIVQKILHYNDSLNHIENYLNSFLTQNKDEIKWCEFHHNVSRNTLSFYRSNIDSNLRIRKILEDKNTSYLSPIISFGNKLDYFINKLSLSSFSKLNIRNNFKEKTIHIILKELKAKVPSTNRTELLNKLLINTTSQILVISRKPQNIYSLQKNLSNKTNKNTICSRHQFISKKDISSFNANKKAILLATYDQLQSIKYKLDVKNVIILDLPFMDISSPYNYYRISQLRKKQKHWFNSYVLPEAVLKYKSTLYNIICRQKDLITIIDMSPRLSKKYGAFFTNWLPKSQIVNIDKCIQAINEKK